MGRLVGKASVGDWQLSPRRETFSNSERQSQGRTVGFVEEPVGLLVPKVNEIPSSFWLFLNFIIT